MVIFSDFRFRSTCQLIKVSPIFWVDVIFELTGSISMLNNDWVFDSFEFATIPKTQDSLVLNLSVYKLLKIGLIGYTAGSTWSKFVRTPNWEN